MFDNLDRLEVGESFVVHTLGDAYCYSIYQTEVVTPEEARQCCEIVAGQDLCTLFTCTPYGINTHRLLVHGRRIPYTAPQVSAVSQAARLATTRRTRPTLLLVAGLMVTTVTRLVRRFGKRRVGA